MSVVAVWEEETRAESLMCCCSKGVLCMFSGPVSARSQPLSEEGAVHPGLLSNLAGQSASHLAAAQVAHSSISCRMFAAASLD